MKTALITGVSSGFGKALTIKLIKEGWKVIGISKNRKKIAALKKEVDSANLDIVTCDLTDDVKLQESLEKITKKYRPLFVVCFWLYHDQFYDGQ